MKNDIKQLLFLIMAIVGVAIFSGAASAATVDKTTVIVRANSQFVFDKAANTYKWGWLPLMDFTVNGPIERGSVVSFEMTTPDGKPWVAVDCETDAVRAGETLKIDNCGVGVLKAEKQSLAVGQYGFKINLKNELQGANQTLFDGKFKADRVFYGESYGNKEYRWYVDYDWALPIAEVFPDAFETSYGGRVEKQAQPLVVSFWFRGPAPNAVAYLFYNGREIGNTETTTSGIAVGEQGITLFDKQEVPFSWVKNKYQFTHVLVSNTEKPDNHADAFRMDKNPGEYEVKVLRKGKLVRTLKFTVGANGKIVDSNVTRDNELGTARMTFFASVLGDEEGRQPNLQAYKTTAFFGSPLKGFGQ